MRNSYLGNVRNSHLGNVRNSHHIACVLLKPGTEGYKGIRMDELGIGWDWDRMQLGQDGDRT